MLATGAQSLNKRTIAHIYWSDRVSQGGIQLRKQKEIVYLHISFFGVYERLRRSSNMWSSHLAMLEQLTNK